MNNKLFNQYVFNVGKINTSAHKGQPQDNTEKIATLMQTSSEAFYTVHNINGSMYGIMVDNDRMYAQLRRNGKKDSYKYLAPFGKNQLLAIINTADNIDRLGDVGQLEKYRSGHYEKNKNNGQAVEDFLRRKFHTTTDKTGSYISGGDKFVRHTVSCEIKFFDWDKNSGTPSATEGKR